MAILENPWGGDKAAATGEPRRLGGPSPKLSKKVSQKFERTKEAASTGVKKVKEGASNGVNWIKVKMNKNKLFQKK